MLDVVTEEEFKRLGKSGRKQMRKVARKKHTYISKIYLTQLVVFLDGVVVASRSLLDYALQEGGYQKLEAYQD